MSNPTRPRERLKVAGLLRSCRWPALVILVVGIGVIAVEWVFSAPNGTSATAIPSAQVYLAQSSALTANTEWVSSAWCGALKQRGDVATATHRAIISQLAPGSGVQPAAAATKPGPTPDLSTVLGLLPSSNVKSVYFCSHEAATPQVISSAGYAHRRVGTLTAQQVHALATGQASKMGFGSWLSQSTAVPLGSVVSVQVANAVEFSVHTATGNRHAYVRFVSDYKLSGGRYKLDSLSDIRYWYADTRLPATAPAWVDHAAAPRNLSVASEAT